MTIYQERPVHIEENGISELLKVTSQVAVYRGENLKLRAPRKRDILNIWTAISPSGIRFCSKANCKVILNDIFIQSVMH